MPQVVNVTTTNGIGYVEKTSTYPIVASDDTINCTANVQFVVAVPLIVDLNAGQYVRLFYRGSSTNVRLLAVAAQANPTRPDCPSMILTVMKVSR